MTKPVITQEDRDYADDMGYAICEECGSTFIPLPGLQNDGHQCGEDGTQAKFALPVDDAFQESIGIPQEHWAGNNASHDKRMVEDHGITAPRP